MQCTTKLQAGIAFIGTSRAPIFVHFFLQMVFVLFIYFYPEIKLFINNSILLRRL